MNHIYINTKLLLLISFFTIAIVYYFLFPFSKIIEIIKGEYIIFAIISLLFFVSLFQNRKLKELDILAFIPNINHVPLKSTILFFLVFSLVDYFLEGGFIAVISLWFTYWCFGLLAYLLTININLYKNLQFYKNDENIKEQR